MVMSSYRALVAPNSAPVLEYRCLYSSDIRRKQKRWQDGRIKFHTFNKRVMVYDDRGNFVGDTHWREDYAFAEGEELELERAGFLIQVSEYVGKRDQDLTELLEKRAKDREEGLSKNQIISAQLRKLPPAPPNQSPITEPLQTTTSHLRKPLPAPPNSSILLGQSDTPEERAQKRRKHDSPLNKNGYAQN